MAEKGRGKKVRFQGGTVFPAVVALVVVLGVLLIGYARSSSYAKAPGPRASDQDHFHIAYGFYNCDAWAPNVVGNGEQNPRYASYGVHSHDDGVIHYHPYTGVSSGRNAKLKRFLEIYDIELTDTKLTMPADQGGLVLEEGVSKCTVDGKEVDGQLKVVVWNDASNPADNTILAANMDDARITRTNMAIAIGFVPEGTALPIPETAANLDTLGAVDGGDVTATTVAGATGSTIAATTNTSVVVVGEPTESTAAESDTTDSKTTDAPATSG